MKDESLFVWRGVLGKPKQLFVLFFWTCGRNETEEKMILYPFLPHGNISGDIKAVLIKIH